MPPKETEMTADESLKIQAKEWAYEVPEGKAREFLAKAAHLLAKYEDESPSVRGGAFKTLREWVEELGF